MAESRREMATRHVQAGREIVESQRRLLSKLKTNGLPSEYAERLLDLFESSLRLFEDDLENIISKQDE